MSEEQYVYLIGVGSQEDWQAGRGSLYFIEDRCGERAMPVFTTPEGVEGHIEANFNRPEAHMQMLESIAGMPYHAKPLTEGRFIIMPVTHELVIEAALRAGIDYLVRDPRPGREQEILRLTEEEES
jgi:hypothetical protein